MKGGFLTLFINRIRDITSDMALIEARMGQGLMFTR